MKQLIKAFIFSMILALTTGTTWAEKYKVDLMTYQNKGAYMVKPVTVVFKHKKLNGSTIKCEHANNTRELYNGYKMDYNLGLNTNTSWWNNRNSNDCPNTIKEGSEVWMAIRIRGGEKESCRKENTKFYYYEDGGKVKYISRGTTLKNNRCRIFNKPSNQYILTETKD